MENPNQRKRHRSDDDGSDDNNKNNKNNERTHHHKSLESLSCLFRQHAELMKSQSDALFHMCGMSTKISSRNTRSSIDVDDDDVDDDDDDHNDLNNNNNNNNSSSSISRSNSNDSVISYSSSSSSSSSISMKSRTIRIQPSKSELITNIEKLFYQKVIIEQTINPNQCTVKEFRILVEEEMKLVCELSIAKKKILKECLMDLITRYNNGDFVDNTTKTLSCI